MRDSELIFSDGQVIVANATTVVSTNLIDSGAIVDHVGSSPLAFGPENGNLRLVITVKVQPTAGTGLQVEFTDCATVDGTYKSTGIGINDAIPIATLVPGYEILNVPLPRGLRRYWQLLYTTTGDHTGSVGSINAEIVNGSTTRNQTPYRA
jgi:hypothetical protein